MSVHVRNPDVLFCDGYGEPTCFWKRLEVPRECGAEFSMVFFDRMEVLMDPAWIGGSLRTPSGVPRWRRSSCLTCTTPIACGHCH